jgi:hypothetical protein
MFGHLLLQCLLAPDYKSDMSSSNDNDHLNLFLCLSGAGEGDTHGVAA